MTLLGGVLGSLLAFAVVLGLSALRPAVARAAALLGWLALAVGTGLSLWPLLARNTDPTSFFAVIYLGLGVLAGLLFALPRRRWREAGWITWGVGLLTPLLLTLGGLGVDAGLARLLPPEQKAVMSSGFVNGLLWSLLPALGVALLARAGQKAGGK